MNQTMNYTIHLINYLNAVKAMSELDNSPCLSAFNLFSVKVAISSCPHTSEISLAKLTQPGQKQLRENSSVVICKYMYVCRYLTKFPSSQI